MFHERQSRQLCLKHALNNVLQRAAFSRGDLDGIAAGLWPAGGVFGTLRSPHYTPWLGNYDVSVLEVALVAQHMVNPVTVPRCAQGGFTACVPACLPRGLA